MDADSILGAIFSFENYGELLVLVQNSIWAGAVLGLLGGLVGTFVMKRDLAFAVHGISELSFAGAAFALLIGADIVFGSLVGSVAAALLLGLMGVRARDKNSIIGVIMRATSRLTSTETTTVRPKFLKNCPDTPGIR
ncbi:MAG: metal ABC transporter permease, partial [Actinomycetes bacterium]